jgi:hypothetical protein
MERQTTRIYAAAVALENLLSRVPVARMEEPPFPMVVDKRFDRAFWFFGTAVATSPHLNVDPNPTPSG